MELFIDCCCCYVKKFWPFSTEKNLTSIDMTYNYINPAYGRISKMTGQPV